MLSKKVFSILTFTTMFVLSLSVGAMLGGSVTASECENEGSYHISSCNNDIYMGAYWNGDTAYVNYDEVDSATIRTYFQNAINHYNRSQNHLDIYRTTTLPASVSITAEDSSLPGSDWTGKAYNSWQGGWPIDEVYNNVGGVNIVINTETFWHTNNDVEQATVYHEMGHAVGMGHRNDQDTIMYCSRARNVTSLTSADITILKNIYDVFN